MKFEVEVEELNKIKVLVVKNVSRKDCIELNF